MAMIMKEFVVRLAEDWQEMLERQRSREHLLVRATITALGFQSWDLLCQRMLRHHINSKPVSRPPPRTTPFRYSHLNMRLFTPRHSMQHTLFGCVPSGQKLAAAPWDCHQSRPTRAHVWDDHPSGGPEVGIESKILDMNQKLI